MAALETVIEDTEAELARVNRSKVANMVKMYQSEPLEPAIEIPVMLTQGYCQVPALLQFLGKPKECQECLRGALQTV